MPLTDQELRALVRDAIARASAGEPGGGAARALAEPDPAASFRRHASHVRLAVFRGSDDDGACLIEPAVRCNHCGYCQSYGH
jgi:hypothetical protein